jgi:hypothetical protein
METATNLPAVNGSISEVDNFTSMIERLATNKDVDVEKLERMMAMQERILDRNAKMAFTSALAAMQEDMPEVSQNGEIKHGDKVISKYAKFEDINEAVKPVLQKHGFAISFRVKQPDSKIEVTAILSHREGHSEETSIILPADTGGAKNAVQAQGSSVAYGKRYAMCALLNITSRGEDDDGQGTDTIDTEQAANLDTLIRSTSADRKAFLEYFKVDDVRNVKARDYANAVKMLTKKAKKAGAV